MKHLAEGVRLDYSKDRMYMIGHHDGCVQVDCPTVLFLNHGHYQIACLGRKLECRMTTKRNEVGSPGHFQVWRLAAPNDELADFHGSIGLEITDLDPCRMFLTHRRFSPEKNTG